LAFLHTVVALLQASLHVVCVFLKAVDVRFAYLLTAVTGGEFILFCNSTLPLNKGAARGGAERAQAPPLAIRILMVIS